MSRQAKLTPAERLELLRFGLEIVREIPVKSDRKRPLARLLEHVESLIDGIPVSRAAGRRAGGKGVPRKRSAGTEARTHRKPIKAHRKQKKARSFVRLTDEHRKRIGELMAAGCSSTPRVREQLVAEFGENTPSRATVDNVMRQLGRPKRTRKDYRRAVQPVTRIVVPAKARTEDSTLDSRLRGNDEGKEAETENLPIPPYSKTNEVVNSLGKDGLEAASDHLPDVGKMIEGPVSFSGTVHYDAELRCDRKPSRTISVRLCLIHQHEWWSGKNSFADAEMAGRELRHCRECDQWIRDMAELADLAEEAEEAA